VLPAALAISLARLGFHAIGGGGVEALVAYGEFLAQCAYGDALHGQ
jgi:hypothetical protein